MSYDLMVFEASSVPQGGREEFMTWYGEQVEWSEGHSYDNPEVSSQALKNWFMEMIQSFPAMNGPFAADDDDFEDNITDYSVGKVVIYAAFAWSVAEEAHRTMIALAKKHNVGFFDVSADSGDIIFPGKYA